MNYTIQEKIKAYREKTFRFNVENQLKTLKDAINFVNERSFVLFHPSKEIILPSLWAATAGDRPVPNEHDDPGHITWGWKDDALGQKVWYYGRLIRRRMTHVSLSFLPYFYALSPNYGDYENDYLLQYKNGTLINEAKILYEILLEEGPLNTIELRKKAGISGINNQYRFSKGIDNLQIEMKILPVGIAEAGRWKYSFIYEILPRHFSDIEMQSRRIKVSEAERKLVMAYLRSVGGATQKGIGKIFSWSNKRVEKVINSIREMEPSALGAIVDEENMNALIVTPEVLYNGN